MPRRKQAVQKQRRRKAFQPEATAAPAMRPTGAFRIFTNYRLFAIIGTVALVTGFALSAYTGVHGGQTSHGASSVRGSGATRATATAQPRSETQRAIKQYAAPPRLTIDPAKRYVATITTAGGDVRVELLPRLAPETVNNFVFLARDGFYDGVAFTRVIADAGGTVHFVQAGDPTGTGIGGPGYDLPVEQTHEPFAAGVLAMARPNEAGAPNNGSQFFITLLDEPTLAGRFTVFGRVIAGLDVLRALQPRDPQLQREPPAAARIDHVIIDEM